MDTNYLDGKATALLTAAIILVSLAIGTAEAKSHGKSKYQSSDARTQGHWDNDSDSDSNRHSKKKRQNRKVTICHLSKGSGVFKPISVGRKAAKKHLRRHDDQRPNVDPGNGAPILDEECYVTAPAIPVLARAYIDADPRDGGYNEGIDRDIAILFDSDATPGLSAGDSIEFGEFPTSYDACPTPATCETDVTNLTGETIAIQSVDLSNPTSIIVTMETPPSDAGLPHYEVYFYIEGHPTRGDYEVFNIDGLDGTELYVRDSHESITREWTFCQYAVAGDPQLCTAQFDLPALTRETNDPFLEVEIY